MKPTITVHIKAKDSAYTFCGLKRKKRNKPKRKYVYCSKCVEAITPLLGDL